MLLELAQKSDVQYILATHSIELLTLHKDNVLRLELEYIKKGEDDEVVFT